MNRGPYDEISWYITWRRNTANGDIDNGEVNANHQSMICRWRFSQFTTSWVLTTKGSFYTTTLILNHGWVIAHTNVWVRITHTCPSCNSGLVKKPSFFTLISNYITKTKTVHIYLQSLHNGTPKSMLVSVILLICIIEDIGRLQSRPTSLTKTFL